MIEERSAIGGSSEVEEVECWMGLREAIQRASQALQGQPGIWEALLREAGGVQRRRRRASVAFQMWFRCGSEVWLFRCGSDGDVIRMGLFGAPTESEPRFLSGLHGCPATGGVQSASLDATPPVRRAFGSVSGRVRLAAGRFARGSRLGAVQS